MAITTANLITLVRVVVSLKTVKTNNFHVRMLIQITILKCVANCPSLPVAARTAKPTQVGAYFAPMASELTRQSASVWLLALEGVLFCFLYLTLSGLLPYWDVQFLSGTCRGMQCICDYQLFVWD